MSYFAELPMLNNPSPSYACELEHGDVTSFGTVDRIERFVTPKGLERVRVYMTDGTTRTSRADSTFQVAGE